MHVCSYFHHFRYRFYMSFQTRMYQCCPILDKNNQLSSPNKVQFVSPDVHICSSPKQIRYYFHVRFPSCTLQCCCTQEKCKIDSHLLSIIDSNKPPAQYFFNIISITMMLIFKSINESEWPYDLLNAKKTTHIMIIFSIMTNSPSRRNTISLKHLRILPAALTSWPFKFTSAPACKRNVSLSALPPDDSNTHWFYYSPRHN